MLGRENIQSSPTASLYARFFFDLSPYLSAAAAVSGALTVGDWRFVVLAVSAAEEAGVSGALTSASLTQTQSLAQSYAESVGTSGALSSASTRVVVQPVSSAEEVGVSGALSSASTRVVVQPVSSAEEVGVSGALSSASKTP